MIGCVLDVGAEVVVGADVAVVAVVVGSPLVDVEVEVVVAAELVADVLGEVVVAAGDVVVAEAVALGEDVAVAVGVALAGVPDVQVTELPSAERTQVIFDPELPDGVGAGEGTFDPDPGTTTDGRAVGAAVAWIVGIGGTLRRLPVPGPVVRLTVPLVVLDAPPPERPPVERVCEPEGRLIRAAALMAAARLTGLMAGRRCRALAFAAVSFTGGERGPEPASPLVVAGPAAEATGNAAPVGPSPRAMRSSITGLTLRQG